MHDLAAATAAGADEVGFDLLAMLVASVSRGCDRAIVRVSTDAFKIGVDASRVEPGQ